MSIVLKALKREKLGTAESRKIKNSGRIPAVIYSKDGNINFSIDTKEFEKEYFKGTSLVSIFEIELDGKKTKVTAHKVELDPVSDRPVHIDFMNCDDLKALRAKPRLDFINQDRSPGLKKGGFLHVVVRKVEVLCENEKVIPEKIAVDVGTVQVGQKIRSHDLVLPAGVKLLKKSNFLLASITGRGKAEEETAATPAAGAAAPAAGAAAAPAKADDKKPADKKPADKK
jgi:large subunit ribosomal protein L25